MRLDTHTIEGTVLGWQIDSIQNTNSLCLAADLLMASTLLPLTYHNLHNIVTKILRFYLSALKLFETFNAFTSPVKHYNTKSWSNFTHKVLTISQAWFKWKVWLLTLELPLGEIVRQSTFFPTVQCSLHFDKFSSFIFTVELDSDWAKWEYLPPDERSDAVLLFAAPFCVSI